MPFSNYTSTLQPILIVRLRKSVIPQSPLLCAFLIKTKGKVPPSVKINSHNKITAKDKSTNLKLNYWENLLFYCLDNGPYKFYQKCEHSLVMELLRDRPITAFSFT